MDTDSEHLRLLSIFHYILAGISALMGCFLIFYFIMGLFLVFGGFGHGTDAPPVLFGFIIIIFACILISIGWTIAVIAFLSGRRLANRTHHNFCFIVACIECIFMPLGTVLGVFTIIVLNRDSVRKLFGLPSSYRSMPHA